MSRIDELITELCPDGVEYRTIGAIADCYSGATPNTKKPEYWENGAIPWMSSGDVNLGIVKDVPGRITDAGFSNCSTKTLPANTVVVALAGQGKTRGKVALTKIELCTNQSLCGIVLKDSSVLPEYLYRYLDSRYDHLRLISNGDGTRGGLTLKMIRSYEIPVPPIEVQREVVRVLDAFTSLTDELTAKLAEEATARRQQYAYYRDRLLSRESLEALDGKPVEMKRLGDVGAFYGGLTGKSKEDFKEGSSLFVPYTNVYNNAAVDFENLDTVNVADGERQHEIAYGDVLITGSSETPDDCGMTSVVMQSPEVQTYLNSFCFGWRPNSLEAFEPGYLKYAFRAYGARRQIVKTANGVTRFNISKEAFGRVEIPVPSIAAQRKVVDILDRFDALTTSLTDGLPAEIEARKAQYGYYRDRLLDFPRKSGDAS